MHAPLGERLLEVWERGARRHPLDRGLLLLSIARPDDALGEVIVEVNALGETLRTQRLDAVEATLLLRTVMTEIEVAIFARSTPTCRSASETARCSRCAARSSARRSNRSWIVRHAAPAWSSPSMPTSCEAPPHRPKWKYMAFVYVRHRAAIWPLHSSSPTTLRRSAVWRIAA